MLRTEWWLHILWVSRSFSQEAGRLRQDICEIWSAFICRAVHREEFSDASATVRDGLEMTIAFLLSLFQASPDVDEEGFSLRPGDEGDDILLVKSGSSSSGSPGTLLLQNYWPVWLSDLLDECFSALNRPNQYSLPLLPHHMCMSPQRQKKRE